VIANVIVAGTITQRFGVVDTNGVLPIGLVGDALMGTAANTRLDIFIPRRVLIDNGLHAYSDVIQVEISGDAAFVWGTGSINAGGNADLEPARDFGQFGTIPRFGRRVSVSANTNNKDFIMTMVSPTIMELRAVGGSWDTWVAEGGIIVPLLVNMQGVDSGSTLTATIGGGSGIINYDSSLRTIDLRGRAGGQGLLAPQLLNRNATAVQDPQLAG
jgi:hypothetical protein